MLPPQINVTLFLSSIVTVAVLMPGKGYLLLFFSCYPRCADIVSHEAQNIPGKLHVPRWSRGRDHLCFNPLTFSLCSLEKECKSLWGKTRAGDYRKVKNETSVMFSNEKGSKEQGFSTSHTWPFLSPHLHISYLSLARPMSTNTPWYSKTLLALWN